MIITIDKNNLSILENKKFQFQTPFSYEIIKQDIEANIFSKYFIYLEKSIIIGFVNYYDLYDRFEIVNIEVTEKARQRHVASQMMEHLIELGKEKQIQNITLEVKEDNIIAQNLYRKYDFQIVAKRPHYYNGIDGYLMERKMM